MIQRKKTASETFVYNILNIGDPCIMRSNNWGFICTLVDEVIRQAREEEKKRIMGEIELVFRKWDKC